MSFSGSEIHELIVSSRASVEKEAQSWDKYLSWYSADADQPDGAPVSPSAGGDAAVARDDLRMKHNYTYAFVDTMIANVCPTNPALTINTPDDSVRDQAKARERLINATLVRNQAHDTLWRSASRAAISGRGPGKVVWDYRRRIPAIHSVDPRAFFFDKTVPYWQTPYVCEATPIRYSQWQARLKRGSDYKYDKAVAEDVKPTGFPDWLRYRDDKMSSRTNPVQDVFKWVLLYEFYDLESGRYYHFADGVKEPLYEGPLPYRYMRNPYPMLTFNDNLRDYGGLSDIKLIAGIQERLDELDTMELQFAHSCIPAMFVNETYLDNPEGFYAQLSSGHAPNDIIHYKSNQPMDIRSVIMPKPLPQAVPQWKAMREDLEANIEFTLGIPVYSRGAVGGAEVATELALADTATRTRNGRRERIMGDFVKEIGLRVGALWQEYLEYEDRSIPVYLEDAKEPIVVNSSSFVGPEGDANLWEDSWYFQIEAVPFSPTENHRLVQLNKVQSFVDFFVQNPNVDKRKLTAKVLELLGMDNLITDTPAPEQAATPAGPGAPAQPTPPAAGGDNTLTGAMPPGTNDIEEFNPADVHALAGQVTASTR